MEELSISRFSGFEGHVHLPGSKSISNRAILLAALSSGKTTLKNLPLADDIEVLLTSLPLLGLRVEADHQALSARDEINSHLGAGHSFIIHGNNGVFQNDFLELNLDNAGTALRPLVAILSAGQGHYIVNGNEQMQKRPVSDLIAALKSLDVNIDAPSGCPPVEIHATGIKGGIVEMSGAVSSQFISAMMMSAVFMKEGLKIQLSDEPVSQPYIKLTIAVLNDFGIKVEQTGSKIFSIPMNQKLESINEYIIEGDASAATYFMAGGALPGCGPVVIHGLGKNSIQGDLGFTRLLEKMGASIELQSHSIRILGPPAGQKLKALDVDMNDMPDAAMTLAVLALFCDGTTHIRNIKNLRVKESERIRGLHTELLRLGAKVVEEESSLHISPAASLRAASIETYDDHRMAMAFSLAAFGVDIKIQDPACVSKTYKNYFDDFLPMAKR